MDKRLRYPDPDRLTTDQAAGLLGVSKRTLYRMQAQGIIASKDGPAGTSHFKWWSRREVEALAPVPTSR